MVLCPIIIETSLYKYMKKKKGFKFNVCLKLVFSVLLTIES